MQGVVIKDLLDLCSVGMEVHLEIGEWNVLLVEGQMCTGCGLFIYVQSCE